MISKKGRAGKSTTRRSRGGAAKAPAAKGQVQKTLPDMFTRTNKRKQQSEELQGSGSMERDCGDAYRAAKKAPEMMGDPYSFPHCFSDVPSHVSAVYDGSNIQSSSMAPPSLHHHSFFSSNFAQYSGAGVQESQSFLTVSGRRQWDLETVNPNFRTRPPSNVQQMRPLLPPLPSVSWSDSGEMWNLMCWKDSVYGRDPHYFHRHPSIQPRMRAILLDWISEVCDVYKLHRETYHLTVDFVDRYLSKAQDVPKEKLQLVGVTALFIAAKLEEIYPPKCSEFATVTDGACDESEIRDQEVIILKRLNWALSPVSANNWLTVYLQLLQRECELHLKPRRHGLTSSPSPEFVFPKFNRHSFLQLSRLVDLCLLDPGSVRFQYGVLSASALCSLFEPEDVVLKVSGFRYEDIRPCLDWMRPFTETVKELGEVQIRIFSDIQEEDHHNIQTHEFDLSLLDRAECGQREAEKYRLSPDYEVNGRSLSAIFPTPPQSDERPPMHLTRFPSYTMP